MIILGIDTSSDKASCALASQGSLICQKTGDSSKKHAQTVMPMIVELMEEAGFKPGNIDAFSISQGPGSFTGLRIGMSVIKAMAYALGKDVICIPTLDVLANMHPETSSMVLPMVNARNDQVYTALYKWVKGRYEPVTEYMGIHISGVSKIIEGSRGDILTCGDAAWMHHQYLEEHSSVNIVKPGEGLLYPSAGTLVLMAYSFYNEGKGVPAGEAIPFYLRVSQAERLFNNENN
jgi:tRNA threonylcarbamoyladenosine biosynthesis protein TsaB